MNRKDLINKFKAEYELHEKLEKEMEVAWANAVKTIESLNCSNCMQKLSINNYDFCGSCKELICVTRNSSYNEPCYVKSHGRKICQRCIGSLVRNK